MGDMHYVYLIKGARDKFYIGLTSDLEKRLTEHNQGLSFATKPYRPWRLVYVEGYANPDEE